MEGGRRGRNAREGRKGEGGVPRTLRPLKRAVCLTCPPTLYCEAPKLLPLPRAFGSDFKGVLCRARWHAGLAAPDSPVPPPPPGRAAEPGASVAWPCPPHGQPASWGLGCRPLALSWPAPVSPQLLSHSLSLLSGKQATGLPVRGTNAKWA